MSKKIFYPINLDVENKKCIVVGGGKVALRKISDLVKAGANVEVISPEVCAEISELVETGKINLVREKYSPEKISGGLILIAATDNPEVNRQIAEDGRRKKFLVNVVNGAESDFFVPSKILREDFQLTISTGGNSPAFSRFVRLMLEKEFDSNFGECLKIISRYREKLKKKFPDTEERKNFWREFLTPEIWQFIKAGDFKKLEELLQAVV